MTHLRDHYKFWNDRIIVKNYKTANDEMERMRKEAGSLLQGSISMFSESWWEKP
jgi:hypothetical protein